MRTLGLLAVVLAAAVATFLLRGLPEADRLHTAHRELAERRAALVEMQRTVDLVPYEAFAALSARRDLARALVQRRRAALADDSVARPAEAFEERLPVLGVLRASGLVAGVRAQAAAAPEAQAALTALLAALPENPALTLEALDLQQGGAPRSITGLPSLREVRAQVVLTGAPEDVLACLEAFCVDRGQGLPAPTVLTASLRRIEPERWGAELHRLQAPPVRLSATVSVLLPLPAVERS